MALGVVLQLVFLPTHRLPLCPAMVSTVFHAAVQAVLLLLPFLKTLEPRLYLVMDRTAALPHSFLPTQRLPQYHAMALTVHQPHSLQVPRPPPFPATDQTAAPELVLPLSL